MHVRHLLTLTLASLAISATAAEPIYLKVDELLQSERAQKFMDPKVKLYWGDEVTPAFQEISRPDRNTGISLNGALLSAGTKEHCVAAFENALDGMVRSALSGGFDAVVNIRVGQGKTPATDAVGFNCTPGYRTTDVRLWGSFAMTPAAAQRYAEAERQSAAVPAREPAKGAIFIPIDSVLASPQLKKILGRHVRAYWGLDAPTYDERTHSADEYSEEAEIGSLTREDACKQAALNTLESMVKEARKVDFDSIIRIRSFHNEQLTPVATDIECELGKKEATVTLRAFMANRK